MGCTVSVEQRREVGSVSLATRTEVLKECRRIRVLPPLGIVRISQVQGPRKRIENTANAAWVYCRSRVN